MNKLMNLFHSVHKLWFNARFSVRTIAFSHLMK